MTNNTAYRVLPYDPNYQEIELTKWEKGNTKGLGGGLGCLMWGVIFLASYFIIGFLGFTALGSANSGAAFSVAFVLAIIIASGGVTVLTFTISGNKIERLEREKNENARKAELDRVTKEAASITSGVARNFQVSTQLKTEIPNHLAQASAWLQNADAEFVANAYGPFWDAIENAAMHLSEFNGKTNQLARNAADYYKSLNDRNHNFPAFPVQSTNLPHAVPVINNLRRVVRMGQTNFQFANIWEHRRTREVLIAGFQTLGEAVNNLGSVIDNSINNLQQSVSSDIARVVEEQIRSRESFDQRMLEQNRMLDNIQHQRKPDALGTVQK
jgi:hypothetical protein